MSSPTKLILPITLIILSVIVGCNRNEVKHRAAIETTLIIGPYKVDCVGAFEQECYLEFNEESHQKMAFFL